ncbi:hypothetical protein WK94_16840 [Burkholderia ubonensis]|uniref:hypothetical protein n=1 Tax=Burkholderia ubonensis TaxID=101571 RepID=UPI00075D2633|nr:hypothetical protein [Burkholderia ubonensis]KVW21490.1 hypothetical protein WK94_16840 [Burkholderia ubonensis]
MEKTERTSGALALINVEMEGIGGAVVRVLRGLSRLDLAVVIAAALPSGHPSSIRRAAIELIAAFALPAKLVKRVESGLARRLIARHFGGRIDYKELGEIYDLDPSNVRRRARLVSDAIELEERATWDRLASLLRDVGALPIGTHLARGT